MHPPAQPPPPSSVPSPPLKQNRVSTVSLEGQNIVCLMLDGSERLCLAQISNTLLKDFSYNEIHNRRVALGITCVQCTPVQLEILRRAGAMPVSSRRCGMISKREAERLVKSFLDDSAPLKLPDDFVFDVKHVCGWGGRGTFVPARYNSSRAKCIQCSFCNMYFSPNKFIFHFHRTPDATYNHPDAANFNSWRRHLTLCKDDDHLQHLWEDVKAMFNGGTRKRTYSSMTGSKQHKQSSTFSEDKNKTIKLESNGMSESQVNPIYPSRIPSKHSPMSPMNHVPQPLYPHYNLPANVPVGWPNIPINRCDVNPQATNTSTLYPPYEMIWAKHLGLRLPEDGFAHRRHMLSPDAYRPDDSCDSVISDTSCNEGDVNQSSTPQEYPKLTSHTQDSPMLSDKHRDITTLVSPKSKTVNNFTDVNSLISHNVVVKMNNCNLEEHQTEDHQQMQAESDCEADVDVDGIEDDNEVSVTYSQMLSHSEEDIHQEVQPRTPSDSKYPEGGQYSSEDKENIQYHGEAVEHKELRGRRSSHEDHLRISPEGMRSSDDQPHSNTSVIQYQAKGEQIE